MFSSETDQQKLQTHRRLHIEDHSNQRTELRKCLDKWLHNGTYQFYQLKPPVYGFGFPNGGSQVETKKTAKPLQAART